MASCPENEQPVAISVRVKATALYAVCFERWTQTRRVVIATSAHLQTVVEHITGSMYPDVKRRSDLKRLHQVIPTIERASEGTQIRDLTRIGLVISQPLQVALIAALAGRTLAHYPVFECLVFEPIQPDIRLNQDLSLP